MRDTVERFGTWSDILAVVEDEFCIGETSIDEAKWPNEPKLSVKNYVFAIRICFWIEQREYGDKDFAVIYAKSGGLYHH